MLESGRLFSCPLFKPHFFFAFAFAHLNAELAALGDRLGQQVFRVVEGKRLQRDTSTLVNQKVGLAPDVLEAFEASYRFL
jgi:hypothetical protein